MSESTKGAVVEREPTIRNLVERIEYMTGGGRPIGPGSRERINELARQAIAIMDRLTAPEPTPATPTTAGSSPEDRQ